MKYITILLSLALFGSFMNDDPDDLEYEDCLIYTQDHKIYYFGLLSNENDYYVNLPNNKFFSSIVFNLWDDLNYRTWNRNEDLQVFLTSKVDQNKWTELI